MMAIFSFGNMTNHYISNRRWWTRISPLCIQLEVNESFAQVSFSMAISIFFEVEQLASLI